MTYLGEDVAEQLEYVPASFKVKIERGERNVTILNIVRIGFALDCSASELLSRAESQPTL